MRKYQILTRAWKGSLKLRTGYGLNFAHHACDKPHCFVQPQPLAIRRHAKGLVLELSLSAKRKEKILRNSFSHWLYIIVFYLEYLSFYLFLNRARSLQFNLISTPDSSLASYKYCTSENNIECLIRHLQRELNTFKWLSLQWKRS